MPAYRFSWQPFDDRTVQELAREIGFSGDKSEARSYLAERVARPNDEFVSRTKDVLTRVWLPQHSGIGTAIVRQLFDWGVGPLGAMPTDAAGCAAYIGRCRNRSRLRDQLVSSLRRYGDVGREGEITGDEDFVPSFGVVVPSKQVNDRRQPYPHQEAAWKKLDDHFREAGNDGVFRGILVMPTGSGKTFTAAHWLTRRWLDAGKRVLWLAHREELLAQAARAFVSCSGLARTQERLRIRQVSSRACRFHQIDPEDQVICCSVHSLARAGSEAEKLLHDPNLFVVIDEAHHAPAKSYRDAIALLEGAGAHRLLGLTATPTRTAERERPALRKLFGDRVIYQVSMNELIAKELLAKPVPMTVKTKVEAEDGMTTEDREHLVTFHEPSSEMLARLGRDERRNHTIVSQYAANAAKFGKTLVFTTDVEAAALLRDRFRQAGIEAEYLASYRPDLKEGEPGVDRREVLRDFAAPRSGLDVLINVDMLTEGVDLPATRTVFLARPTSSEILFRQMVGRALRGPRAGGNREAFIVSFEDHWDTYFDYLTPVDWLNEAGALPEERAPEGGARRQTPSGDAADWVSWDQVLAVAHGIRATMTDVDADVFEAVPHGMYVLDYEADGEEVRHVIHVYEHQRPCWEAMFAHLRRTTRTELAAISTDALDAEYFDDCDPPRASRLDIDTVVEQVRAGNPLPEFVELSGRSLCDPRELAKLAKERDLRKSEETALLTERHTALARMVYPTMVDFQRAFDDAMRELEHPGLAVPTRGVPTFEHPPANPLRSGPRHDLQALKDEMLRTASEIIQGPVPHHGRVDWSGRIIKGWLGRAWCSNQPGVGPIKINLVLDSPDISEGAMKFLLWHEYLHLYLMGGHSDGFRKFERSWPEWARWDRELDGLNERFGVEYWR